MVTQKSFGFWVTIIILLEIEQKELFSGFRNPENQSLLSVNEDFQEKRNNKSLANLFFYGFILSV